MVGQSESDDIFVPELKANELMITGSSVLRSLFQWENKYVDLITIGSLNISSALLWPHHTHFAPAHPNTVRPTQVMFDLLDLN